MHNATINDFLSLTSIQILNMKKLPILVFCFTVVIANNLDAQAIELTESSVEPVNVFMSIEKKGSENVVRVIKDSSIKNFDEPTFVKIKGVNFKNGIIEVKVLSKLLKEAPDFARGFIGIAFRINEDNSQFESIYLRPTNARSDDQVRRNHSIQYYAYPDYKFDRLRKEAPERYESYTDMEINKWITMRIKVKDSQAKLFIGENKEPSLIVKDLKHGASASGAIGLWVDIGTEGFFADLKITEQR